jgi:hypothetical protein
MKNNKIIVASFAFAVIFAGAPGILHAQLEDAAAEAVAAPLIAKAVAAIVPKKDPPGTSWLRAQVIHADSRSMIVQEEANPKMIHTFTYGTEIKGAMQGLENSGGYHYGDKVRILYQQQQPGQFVALRIKGKPS